MQRNTAISVLKTIWHHMHQFRIFLGVTPFRVIDETSNGLVFLSARISTPLARRGEVIAIPRDQMIFSYVRNFGQWGLDEAEFLVHAARSRKCLEECSFQLIDLGAHAGLVSKIFLDNFRDEKTSAVLVDPLVENFQAQKHNLQKYKTRIQFCNMALSNNSGSAEFEIDLKNIGASRLHDREKNNEASILQQVQTISVPDFESKYLQNSSSIILKSDLEGFDVQAVNMFSDEVWQRIIAGVIEIDPSTKLDEKDLRTLTTRLSRFNVSTNSNRPESLTPIEIESIWVQEKRTSSNLYFWV